MNAFGRENSLTSLPLAVYQLWANDANQRITSIIGTILIVYSAYHVISNVWFWVKPSTLPVYCHSESGSWALVTGASDGIGQGFSDDLLRRGFNVLLHGRNPEKLARVRQSLAEKYPKRSVDIVVADASKHDDSYKVVAEKVRKLPGKLTILINNVGGITTKPQYVAHSEISHENIDTILNVNARFPVHLVRELLPDLKENGPSLILNCGSAAGAIGLPYIVTYAGTKAFMHQFSNALKTELLAEGVSNIEVMALVIGNVESAGNKFKTLFTMTSQECAAACLNRVGCGAVFAYTTWGQALQLWFVRFLPAQRMQKILIDEMQSRKDEERKGV